MISALLWAAIQPAGIGCERFDRAVFSTRVIHQPQLLGFDGKKMTTRYEFEVILQRRRIDGKLVEVERHAIEKFPDIYRANERGDIRFSFVDGEWDGTSGSHCWRRIEVRMIWHIVNVYYMEAE